MEGIIVTIRTTESIELGVLNAKNLKNNATHYVAELIDCDDPQLVGVEHGSLDDYEALNRIWSVSGDVEVNSYTYISILLTESDLYPPDNFLEYESRIILDIIQKCKKNEVKFHSLSVKAHDVFDEVHLRFIERMAER